MKQLILRLVLYSFNVLTISLSVHMYATKGELLSLIIAVAYNTFQFGLLIDGRDGKCRY